MLTCCISSLLTCLHFQLYIHLLLLSVQFTKLFWEERNISGGVSCSQNLHNSLSLIGEGELGVKQILIKEAPQSLKRTLVRWIKFTSKHLGEDERTHRGGLEGCQGWQLLHMVWTAGTHWEGEAASAPVVREGFGHLRGEGLRPPPPTRWKGSTELLALYPPLHTL